jgi:hypothetical protein
VLPDDSTGRIARELSWTSQEFFPANIISARFSMLIYHLWDKQQAHWWPQFRDIVSPHRHEQSINQPNTRQHGITPHKTIFDIFMTMGT